MEKELIRFQIADIVFSVCSGQPPRAVRLDASYLGFVCAKQPEIGIYACYDGLPQLLLQNEDMVFDSEGPWSLYRIEERNALVLGASAYGSLPYRIAIFDDDFAQVNLYSGPERLADSLFPDPLEYPFPQVLMICLLAGGRGVMVHACGIDDGGQGYLFAGNSTHGKTTMARLWQDEALILNDDRIVLRWREGRFWMYGMPWHGDYTGVSPQGVPLEKVFFLRHAEANEVRRREDVAAASMLLTRCFPPLWDAEGMRFTLDFCAQLVADVPCYELGFVPDKNVLELVRCLN